MISLRHISRRLEYVVFAIKNLRNTMTRNTTNIESVEKAIDKIKNDVTTNKRNITLVKKDIDTNEQTIKDHISPPENAPRGTVSKIATHFNGSEPKEKNSWYHLNIPKIDKDAGDNKSDSDMFYIHVTGFAYGAAIPIDILFTGYEYQKGKGKLQNTAVHVLNGDKKISAKIYNAKDGTLVCKFRMKNMYYVNFIVESMYVGNGLVLQEGDVKIIISPNDL